MSYTVNWPAICCDLAHFPIDGLFYIKRDEQIEPVKHFCFACFLYLLSMKENFSILLILVL